MSEKCDNCDKYYESVYRVSDDLWLKIYGKSESGLLCPMCCDAIARQKGILLYWEARENEYPTEVL